jgi:hypothetical protein
MSFPKYLTPQYLRYDMIANLLVNVIKVDLVNDPPEPPNTMYLGQVEDLMAQGESYVIQTYLANYVKIPLETLDNQPWDHLLSNPQWYQTATNIKSLFMASAFFYIYEYYFSLSGEGNNGEELIKNAYNQINRQANALLRIDQAGNPLLKNCFIGLKLADNYTQRIAHSCRIPTIASGEDQGVMAINSIPNYRWGWNR